MTAPYLAIVLLVAVLSVARLTRIVTIDQIFAPVRDAVRGRLGADSQITYLLFCPWCFSIWVGAAVGSVLWWGTPVGGSLVVEGVEWRVGVPAFTLVSSWATGVLRGLEE